MNTTLARGLMLVLAGILACNVRAETISWDPAVDDYQPVILAAIERALQEESPVVEFSAGVYPLKSSLSINGAVTLRGVTGGGTVLKSVSPRKEQDDAPVIVDGGATLERLAVTGGSCSSSLWQCYGSGVTVKSGTLAWCDVTNNTYIACGNSWGCGIYIKAGAAVRITHCRIADNRSYASFNPLKGCGICVCGNSEVVIDNCLIVDNDSDGRAGQTQGPGGGIYTDGGNVTIANCTICGNHTTYRGGGIFLGNNNTPNIINCIVVGNRADADPCKHAPDFSAVDSLLTDNVLSDAAASKCKANLISAGKTPFGVDGLAADPVFLTGTYELKTGSPAIGKGVDVTGITDGVDLNGVQRTPGAIDLGCYAYVPSLEPDVLVTLGTAVAFNDQPVEVAISHINPPEGRTLTDVVSVVNGDESYPITVTDGFAVIDRPGVWSVKVELYDGETKLAEAISGTTVKIGFRKAYVTSNPAATPVFPYATEQTAALCLNDVVDLCIDGTEVFLDAGEHRITGRGDFLCGAKVHGAGRDLTWINAEGKEAFYINHEGFLMDHLSVTNTTRSSEKHGLIIAARGGTLRDCRFGRNIESGDGFNTEGIGVLAESASALIEDCLFENFSYDGDFNTCNGLCISVGPGTVRNCLFTGCRTATGKQYDCLVSVKGGGVLENCTIAGNSVKYIANEKVFVAAPLLVSNESTVRNVLVGSFQEICGPGGERPAWQYVMCAVNHDMAKVRIQNCCFEGEEKYGENCADGTRILFDENAPWHIRAQSSCRNAGQDQGWMAGAKDLDGNPRVVGRHVDIGCYECQTSPGMLLLVR